MNSNYQLNATIRETYNNWVSGLKDLTSITDRAASLDHIQYLKGLQTYCQELLDSYSEDGMTPESKSKLKLITSRHFSQRVIQTNKNVTVIK